MGLLINISLRFHLRSKNLVLSRIFANLSTPKFYTRTLSSKEIINEEPKKTFKEIYRFPAIRFGHVFLKTKWPQTVLTALVMTSSVGLYFGGLIDPSSVIIVCCSGVLFTGSVYAYGNILVQAVGFMYLSEDGTTLKISYLDFWGDRINREFPVEDIMPLADCPRSPLDYVYTKIHIYSSDKIKPKLFLKTGGTITDEDAFVKVFGDYNKFPV